MVAGDADAGVRAHQVFVDPAAADQSAEGAVRVGVAVVDLAGRKPAIRQLQLATIAGGLVDQHRPDQSQCGIGEGAPVGTPSHTAFHRGHVEIFDHDMTIGARQLVRM